MRAMRAPHGRSAAPITAPAMRYKTMRRLLGFIGALAVAALLATPVASAAPGQSGWEDGSGQLFDVCTGEFVDNDFLIHVVATDSGPFHLNVQVQGIGETTGSRYVGNTIDN